MTDDERAQFERMSNEIRAIKLDITDLQGAIAELEDDFQRRRLRPTSQ